MPLLLSLVLLMTGCASYKICRHVKPVLTEVARSDRQWTGIAVSRDGRIFVNYPRWSDNVPFSVGELHPDGSVSPYPDAELNRWEPTLAAAEHFVCVQSVVVDREGYLWILDPASPSFQGVVAGGPKLLKIDLTTNRIIQTVRFAQPIIKAESYLNDVRIDTQRKVAYITDSGVGAIVVVDLVSGTSRQLLANHPSTHSEGLVLTIEGRPWRRPDGSAPQIHADGIALDNEGYYLYYQALTGRTLYRIETRWLRDVAITEKELAAKVETLGQTGAADGLIYSPDGRIYLSALEEDAIKSYVPGGRAEIVVKSPELAWPDSFAFGPDGSLYVTTSQIHRGPKPPEPYKIYKLERKP